MEFADEKTQIGIDFDGVIHKCSKGFHDGTIYDPPIEGVESALQYIAQKYQIIVYTAKAKQDRPIINGKTGTELVWEWLRDNKLDHFIAAVTSEKPRAVAYIDDKGVRFNNWSTCLEELSTLGLL
jgi:hypothetical protein